MEKLIEANDKFIVVEEMDLMSKAFEASCAYIDLMECAVEMTTKELCKLEKTFKKLKKQVEYHLKEEEDEG